MDGPDLISNLPEVPMIRIFSFLTTKQVIRTCVLSSRWRNCWTCMKHLSFDDKERYLDTDLHHFASKYHFASHTKPIKKEFFWHSIIHIILVSQCFSFHSFELTVSQIFDPPYDINTLISGLSQREIKKITLIFKTLGNKIFFRGLSEFHTLEELHMKFCAIKIPKIPNVVAFSCLTMLKLEEVTVDCPSNELTLNLPSLKEYVQDHCSWLGVKPVTFKVPLLEVLRIIDNSNDPLEMVFSAVSLRSLFYSGSEVKHTIDLQAVHVASAEIFLMDSGLARVQGMMKFVGRLVTANVERLEVFVQRAEDFANQGYSSDDIPSFGSLVHLEVDNCPPKTLLDLLLKAPCLQTLMLKRLYSGKEQFNFSVVPACFQYMIKVVKFKRFHGDEHELEMAKYLMKNAEGLELISFFYCYTFSNQEMVEEVKKKIFSFKRNTLAHLEFEC